ncbi:hypothetical protein DFH06DRAFT_1177189 [Mycena polygramma]|nr:hypothetical protein DFH06DRAFT_1177189 [Mycena polygramma]
MCTLTAITVLLPHAQPSVLLRVAGKCWVACPASSTPTSFFRALHRTLSTKVRSLVTKGYRMAVDAHRALNSARKVLPRNELLLGAQANSGPLPARNVGWYVESSSARARAHSQ